MEDAVNKDIRGEIAALALKLYGSLFSCGKARMSAAEAAKNDGVSEAAGLLRAALGLSLAPDASDQAEDPAWVRCEAWASEVVYERRALQLPPADSCAVCGVLHSSDMGPRLLKKGSQSLRAYFRQPNVQTAAALPVFAGGRLAVSVSWPLDQGVEMEIAKRAARHLRKAKMPWFCMRCAGGVCACGAPYHVFPGTDVLTDRGTVTHVGMLGHGPVCRACDSK